MRSSLKPALLITCIAGISPGAHAGPVPTLEAAFSTLQAAVAAPTRPPLRRRVRGFDRYSLQELLFSIGFHNVGAEEFDLTRSGPSTPDGELKTTLRLRRTPIPRYWVVTVQRVLWHAERGAPVAKAHYCAQGAFCGDAREVRFLAAPEVLDVLDAFIGADGGIDMDLVDADSALRGVLEPQQRSFEQYLADYAAAAASLQALGLVPRASVARARGLAASREYSNPSVKPRNVNLSVWARPREDQDDQEFDGHIENWGHGEVSLNWSDFDSGMPRLHYDTLFTFRDLGELKARLPEIGAKLGELEERYR